MKKNIAIIGGGNMGEAIIKGLVVRKVFNPAHILVCETNGRRAQYLKEKYRISIKDVDAAIAQSSTVILAVKPQDMETLLAEITACDDQLFISIAAGLTTKFFEKHLGSKIRVIRSMPNMPALIGEGITGICKGRCAQSSDLRIAGKILGSIGKVVEVQEKEMDTITAVSGSGPAYLFLFIEQWMAAACAMGLKESVAKELVYETLLGSAHLLNQSSLSAAELRSKVTSKGGTTQAAMDVFFKRGFDRIIKEALTAAKKRAKELAK